MAPSKKKRKIPKAERKNQAVERGKKGAEKQGKGVGSRQTFTLPAKWQEEEYERGSKTRVQFSSPGKTKYKTQKAVKETLVMRGMKECLHYHLASASSSEESQTEESEFMPSSEGEEMKGSQMKLWKGEEMERRLFVCESSQLMDLVQQINDTSKCSTTDCNGKFFVMFFNSIISLIYYSELDLSLVFVTWTSSRICISFFAWL